MDTNKVTIQFEGVCASAGISCWQARDLGSGAKFNKDGTPLMMSSMTIAIPKTQAAWQNEPWGQVIHGIAKAAFPGGVPNDFAYKLADGDSHVPNRAGVSPAQFGFKNHWLIYIAYFSGNVPLTNAESDFVKGSRISVPCEISYNHAPVGGIRGLYIRPICIELHGGRI